MTAVGQLTLVLGLLVNAHCEVRARDPNVEEEEVEVGGRGGEGGVMETPMMGGTGMSPAQTGNRCAYVHSHVLTVVVPFGTEKHMKKDQSSCSDGSPGCQKIMYRLLMRLTYRQINKVITSLIWRCCPGYRGPNCEDKDVPAGLQLQPQQGNPNQNQNDYQAFFSTQYEPNNQQNSTQPELDPTKTHTYQHHHHQYHQNQAPEHELPWQQSPVVDHVASPHPDIPPVLPVPDMMALVMSQLQPVLEGFNRSLEHLSQQMEVLAQDVEELKRSQLKGERREGSKEDNLDKVFQQIGKVQRQMEDQCRNMENMLHSQHAQLHQNLSSFKFNVNLKLKHHQKLLQVGLQSMNTTLTELKLDQDQFPDQKLEDELLHTSLLHPDPPSDTVALWEAITRLDNMVVNNTLKVGGLMEDVEMTSGATEQLTQHLIVLEKQINQTARTSQVLFMETGLEVEQAKVLVQQRVEELAGNVTQHEQQLQEMDVDVDYLYTVLYKQNSSSDCGLLKAAVTHLERVVANVTKLANENRLALEKNSDGGGPVWDETNDWEPVVEALQHNLQQVKETLVLEESRTRNLDLGVIQLSSSVSALQERDTQQEVQLKLLSASFHSLLEDAIRHSEVLQLLLGEEVLEFLEWTPQDQEAHSLPVLKKQIGELKKQLRQPGGIGDRQDVPSADQPDPSSSFLPSDWPPGGPRRSSGEGPFGQNQQLLLHSKMMQHAGDGSDLWNLEKKVEELQQRLVQLEENPCSCNNTPTDKEAPHSSVKVQLLEEVIWLKRELEEHLRVFKNVFSNADLLAGTHGTLELDKLWELMKKRDKKKRGKGERKSRSRRKEPSVFDQTDGSLLFVGGSPRRVSNGAIVFQSSLNQGRFYSDTGIFTAPVDGIYLFILTLDLRPGPTHVLLRWAEDDGEASMSLQQQEVIEVGLMSGMSLLMLREREEVRLEVRRGEWAESKDNLFFVLLLHQITMDHGAMDQSADRKAEPHEIHTP